MRISDWSSDVFSSDLTQLEHCTDFARLNLPKGAQSCRLLPKGSHQPKGGKAAKMAEKVWFSRGLEWCRRGELNTRPHPYQGCALPLSYGGTLQDGRPAGGGTCQIGRAPCRERGGQGG